MADRSVPLQGTMPILAPNQEQLSGLVEFECSTCHRRESKVMGPKSVVPMCDGKYGARHQAEKMKVVGGST